MRVYSGEFKQTMTTTLDDLSLTTLLEDELSAVVESGFYTDTETFLTDAIRTLLAARPELRIAVACKLYERGTFSLGKAAAWSGLTLEAMKQALHNHGIDRVAPETLAETEAMAHQALQAAAKTAL